jgi:hypothetical protein
MIKLDIRTNFADVERKFRTLQDEVRGKAQVSAVNRTLDYGKTRMARGIAAEFNVTQAYVRERLRLKRASVKQGRFAIEGSLIGSAQNRKRSANIIRFVENRVTLAEARRRFSEGTLDHLFVKIKRKGAKKPLAGAFIGNKGRTVFERVGDSPLPIRPVQVIDVGQMFNTKRINEPVRRDMQRQLLVFYERDLRFFVGKFNSRAR